MAQAGLGEEALRQGSQEPGRRRLSRIPSSQPQPEAAPRGQQTWARAGKAWSRGMGGSVVPTFHSPWPPLYPHASSTNSPLRLNSQGLRGACPWGPHLLQACQPFVVPESWVAGNSSICPLNWTRALLSSEPLRMTRQDQNQKHLE